jgi:2-phosphosulfolactate phosphatase
MTNNLYIRRVCRSEAEEARGVVIVIDVIRAFTVAAYAFAGGARRLWLVRTTDEAFALRQQEPEALLAGEIGGRLIPGFDLNNSPSLMAATNVRGRTIIQRTGAGTQGAVGAINAKHLLICSLANARATATYARHLAETTGGLITLLPTEGHSKQLPYTGEDSICADYLEALLCEQDDAPALLAANLAYLDQAGRFDFMKLGEADFPFEDIALIKGADRFDFVMIGQRKQADGFEYVEVERRELEDYPDR